MLLPIFFLPGNRSFNSNARRLKFKDESAKKKPAHFTNADKDKIRCLLKKISIPRKPISAPDNDKKFATKKPKVMLSVAENVAGLAEAGLVKP